MVRSKGTDIYYLLVQNRPPYSIVSIYILNQ